MYCPNCGDQTTKGLKYCKRCGKGLSGSTSSMEEAGSNGKAVGAMLFLVALVSIAGFIALFTTVYNLGEHPGFDTRALIAIMVFGGATVMGVVGSLVWLLLRLTTTAKEASHHQATPEMPIIREYTPQLPASPASVTEHTTRNFDPSIYSDRGAHE
jgi:hypothetical protein